MYKCKLCEKSFTRERNYENHLLCRSHILREINKQSMFECICGKSFNQRNGLYRHRTTCTVTETDLKLKALEERLEQQEKEKQELRSQISLLLDTHSENPPTPNTTMIDTQNIIDTQTNIDTQNIIDTQTNIDTQNIIDTQNNIVVNINSFGNENIEYLDDDTVIDCIKQLHNSVPAIIEKVHFHPKHPENHNIQVTNRKLPYAKVMGKNQKWKTMNRNDAIERMITNGYNILDDTYEEHKDKFSEFKQAVFEDFQKKYLDDDKETHKKLRTNIDTLILNEGSI